MRFFNIFNCIRFYFGHAIVHILKRWIDCQRNIIKIKAQRDFLHKCQSQHIIPNHLYNIIKKAPTFSNYKLRNRYYHLQRLFIEKLLRIESDDLRKRLFYCKKQNYILTRQIYNNLPVNIAVNFFDSQVCCLSSFHEKERARLNSKLRHLMRKGNSFFPPPSPLEYFAFSPPPLAQNSNNYKLRLRSGQDIVPSTEGNVSPPVFTNKPHSLSRCHPASSFHIFLNPLDFSTPSPPSPLSNINPKWFYNLSSITIPPEVQRLLQLGENFSLPLNLNNNNSIVIEFIKNVENNLRGVPPESASRVRNRAVSILDGFLVSGMRSSSTDKELNKHVKITKRFIRDHPDILFTKADKGNVTVALDKGDYIQKMEEMFSDTNTYSVVFRDPVNKLISDLRTLVKRWKDKGYITEMTYHSLLPKGATISRAYGLPKIHKPNCPFRVIVSSINSPLHSLALYLHKIIFNSVPRSESYISNSFDLIKKLNSKRLDTGYELASLDVVSLFTNVPLDLAIGAIGKRWHFIERETPLPYLEFLSALRLVLFSTFFKFNGKIYKQLYGTPMGSPLSPILADLTLCDLEERARMRIPCHIPLYFRYVDDIVLAAPPALFDVILDTFNSLHMRIKFTIERAVNNSLNFLDLTIMLRDGCFEFNWFHKHTFSGRFLNFFSQHPLIQKRGTIISLVDHAFLLSHPRYHEMNFTLLINILLTNGYPRDFVFSTIKSRLEKLLYSRHSTSLDSDKAKFEPRPSAFFTIPYVKNVSEKFKSAASHCDKRLAFFSTNKLSRFVRVQKDPLPSLERNNVVYRIDCNNCNASYVGQTSRLLKTRVSEHRRHINHNTNQHSVITDHRVNFNHNFNWDGARVLDADSFRFRREISEMVHINLQSDGVNLQSDTEPLGDNYASIINFLSRSNIPRNSEQP